MVSSNGQALCPPILFMAVIALYRRSRPTLGARFTQEIPSSSKKAIDCPKSDCMQSAASGDVFLPKEEREIGVWGVSSPIDEDHAPGNEQSQGRWEVREGMGLVLAIRATSCAKTRTSISRVRGVKLR